MKSSDLFVQALENEQVEYIFGIPGEENLDLIDSLKKLKEDPIPEYVFQWEETDTGKYQRRGKGRPKKHL